MLPIALQTTLRVKTGIAAIASDQRKLKHLQMKKLRRKVYMVAGYNTISMGTGRKEFNPKRSVRDWKITSKRPDRGC